MAKLKTRNSTFYKHAINVLRHGYIDPQTKKRQGKFASGFDPSDGYDLRKIHSWTPAQKAKITRLFKIVDKLTARPFQIYRTSNKKNLRRVQEAAQHGIYPKELKVAFVPSNSLKKKVKIRITKRGVKFKQGHVTRRVIDFATFGYTPDDVAIDPVGVVNDIVARVPASTYKIQAGENVEVGRGKSIRMLGNNWPADRVADVVSRMVNYYSSDTYDASDRGSSYFGNWLFGLVAYNFDKERDFMDYDAAYSRARIKAQDRRAALRQKMKRRQAKEKLIMKRKIAAGKAARKRMGV